MFGTVGFTFTSLLTNLTFSEEIASYSRLRRLKVRCFLSLPAGLSGTFMIEPLCDFVLDWDELCDLFDITDRFSLSVEPLRDNFDEPTLRPSLSRSC